MLLFQTAIKNNMNSKQSSQDLKDDFSFVVDMLRCPPTA